MLKVVRLPVRAQGCLWRLNAITGSLIKETYPNGVPASAQQLPSRIASALALCDDPYKLTPPLTVETPDIPARVAAQLEAFNRILQTLRNKWLIFSVLYAGRRKPIFENTAQAMVEISTLYKNGSGSDCLQKSLLAVKTSKSFTSDGVLFIGATLPTGNMHAWIIENNEQPDILDRHWINYQPLLAIYA